MGLGLDCYGPPANRLCNAIVQKIGAESAKGEGNALGMTKSAIYPGVKRSRILWECGSVYHLIFFLFPFCLAVSKNIAAEGRGCGDPLHQLALTLEVSGKGGR